MKCTSLAERIELIRPDADAREVARLCLLMGNCVGDPGRLQDESVFDEAWQKVDGRLKSATDQHAAMTAELEELAHSNPQQLSLTQIWVLIRAIKVQSQILQLYVGESPHEYEDN